MLSALALTFALFAAKPEGMIAFSTGGGQEDRCVCVVDLATGVTTRVGPGSHDGTPRWSPDGQWLAFTSRANDGLAVYLVRPDGAEGRFLNHAKPWNFAPNWSPDGRRLAYASSPDMTLACTLTVHDITSGTETTWANAREGMMTPVWMPSLDLMKALDPEEKLVLEGLDTARFLEEGASEGVLAAAGLVGEPGKLSTELFLVTRSQVAPLLALLLPKSKQYAEWSPQPDPDGQRFAFESNDGGDREVFVLGKRGIGDVSNHRAADWNPVWSPEGGYLAFESFRDGRRGLYGVYPETARVFTIAAGSDFDCWSIAWSPDEDWLAFVSDRDGFPRLYLARRDGSELRRLTGAALNEYTPAWRPEAQK